MSIERENESGLDSLCGLAVRGEELVDVGPGHVDPVLLVHVLCVVLKNLNYIWLTRI